MGAFGLCIGVQQCHIPASWTAGVQRAEKLNGTKKIRLSRRNG
jgi:hypothetical protein